MNREQLAEKNQIFLCYTREDLMHVEQLYQRLSKKGFKPWMDVKDILPSQDWKRLIIQNIREVPFFLACMSNNSVNRRGVIQEEIKEALQVWRQKLDSDIYLIPVRLEKCNVPEVLAKFQWVDLFEPGGFKQLCNAIKAGMERLDIFQPVRLRSQSIEKLSEEDVKIMLQERDFFHKNWYWMGKGIQHQYEEIKLEGRTLVIDHTTGLTWQSTSSIFNTYSKAYNYIERLNNRNYFGYSDWRLPTLEEAMSLLEPSYSYRSKNLLDDLGSTSPYPNERFQELFGAEHLYIDPIFKKSKGTIVTSDRYDGYHAWLVDFRFGICRKDFLGEKDEINMDHEDYTVRAVRSDK